MNYRKRPPSTTTESVLLELFAAGTRAGRLLRTTFRGAPMTQDEYAVYSLLAYRGPTTPARLAAALGMQRSTMSNYLARMDERGDLMRRRDTKDGRSALIELSDDGRRRVEATNPHFRAAFQPFHAALGDRRASAVAILREISAALDTAAREASAPVRTPRAVRGARPRSR